MTFRIFNLFMIMHWPLESQPSHLTLDLEMMMYSHGPSMLSRVMTKKVLNSISKPMKVTCHVSIMDFLEV